MMSRNTGSKRGRAENPGTVAGSGHSTTISAAFGGSTNLSALQVYYLITGQLYANIHTTSHSGGEIRGQLYPGN
jgi:hypothetical protein